MRPLQISFTLREIANAAHQLWQWADGIRVFTFSGSLGAGKTTFIHALCDVLHVQDAVSSPTFALINEYRIADSTNTPLRILYHMDWYRLRNADEAIDAGMEDALHNEAALCFVEWPEHGAELLGISHAAIRLEIISEQERSLHAVFIDQ